MSSDQLDVIELLTSELITNSLIHATSTRHHVTAQQDPRGVHVTVTDGVTGRPLLAPGEHPIVLGGHGLVLVHALADDWGMDHLLDGKATWFRLNHHRGVNGHDHASTGSKFSVLTWRARRD